MTKYKTIYLLLLRIAFGWLFLYSGLTKILNPDWTALEYIKGTWFYAPEHIGIINFLNEWGQLLIGLSLISGVFVRGAAIGGIFLMFLYYLPLMKIPYVDQHIIYILVFLIIASFDKEMKKFNLVLLLSRYLRSLFSPSQKSPRSQK